MTPPSQSKRGCRLDGGPPIEPTELDPYGIGTCTQIPQSTGDPAPDLPDAAKRLGLTWQAGLTADGGRLWRLIGPWLPAEPKEWVNA